MDIVRKTLLCYREAMTSLPTLRVRDEVIASRQSNFVRYAFHLSARLKYHYRTLILDGASPEIGAMSLSAILLVERDRARGKPNE